MRTLSVEEMELKNGGGFWGSFCVGLGIVSLGGGYLVPGVNAGLAIANVACFAYGTYNVFW